MEGLRFGWVLGVRSGIHHYISDFTHKDSAGSLCNKLALEKYYAKKKEYLEKFEILDVTTICPACELKLQDKIQNDSKNEILEQINNASISDGFVLKKFMCAEESCVTSGVAFVSINSPNDQHYCIQHNLRVQETILKEKELVQ
jgi:hypothetical protein